MESIIQFFKLLLDSEEIVTTGGLVLITIIVYAETGLFFCFFLPGDYLLFLAGMFCASGLLPVPILLLITCIASAAILGNFTGYFFGKFVGQKLYEKKDSFFFKKKHLETTREAFKKYGGKALIIGRFLPIVRTFAPILAGTADMKLSVFSFYNSIGAILWVLIICYGGYELGHQFPGMVNYVEYIILGFLLITSATVIRSYFSIRKNQQTPIKD